MCGVTGQPTHRRAAKRILAAEVLVALAALLPATAEAQTAPGEPPMVVGVRFFDNTPLVDGAMNVSASNRIRVEFNEDVTVPDNWLSLTCNNGSEDITVPTTVTGGPRIYLINLASAFRLTAGKQCTFDITSEAMIVDVDSNPLGGDGSFAPRTFTIAGTADNRAPMAAVTKDVGGASTQLVNGATNVELNVDIGVVFDESIRILPVNWYSLTCGENPVPAMGLGEASLPRSSFIVRVTGDLPADSMCTFDITNEHMIRDTGLNALGADMSFDPINFRTVDNIPPMLVTAEINGATLVLTFNEALDEDPLPATGDFTVTVEGMPATVSAVAIDDTTVTLTLDAAVSAGDVVTVAYTAGTNPVQDTSGNDAANIPNFIFASPMSVTNNTPAASTLALPAVDNLVYTVNTAINPPVTLPAATGGTAPYTYTLTGTRPAGLAVSTDNTMPLVLSGRPTTADSTELTYTVTDSAGTPATAMQTFTFTVNAALAAPGAPTGLTATAGPLSIALSWTAPADDGGAAIRGYRIEQSADGSTGWSDIDANTMSADITYTHSGLSSGQTVHYRVSAINSTGTGAVSNVASATAEAPTAPGAPTGLTATVGVLSITLSWDAPASDGGAAITGYHIEQSADGSAGWSDVVADTSSTATTYTHSGLSSGQTVHYRVSAINSAGTSAASGTASATAAADAAGVPPTVVGVYADFLTRPLMDGAMNVSASSRILVEFNEDVTVPDNWFSLTCNNGSEDVTVPTTVTGGPRYRINPAFRLPAGKQCTFDITSEAIIVDADSNPLGGDGSFAPRTFTIAGTADNRAPMAAVTKDVGGASTQLVNGATNVELNADIGVVFDESISILPTNWYSLTCGENPVPAMGLGEASLPRSSFIVRVTGDLPADSMCTFDITNEHMIRDTGLNALGADMSFDPINFRTVDNTPPMLVTAEINGATLVLTFNEALDEDPLPATGNFTVTVGGMPATVSAVAIDDTTVTLTLDAAVSAGDVVTMAYAAGINPVQDTSGNDAANIPNFIFASPMSVTNNTPAASTLALPAVDNLVYTADVAIDSLELPEAEDGTGPYTYTLVGPNGSDLSEVSGLMFDASTRILSGTPTTAAAAVTLTYTVTDSATSPATAMQTFTVTITDGTAPMLSTATVDGATLVLTYNEALDGSSEPANSAFTIGGAATTVSVSMVEVSGRMVTLTLDAAVSSTDTSVTLTYTVPATNPIQDTAGNDAMALTDRSVTNNTGQPTISIAAGPSPVTEGAAATFTVTASPAPTSNLVVNISVTDSGAFAAAGQTGARTVTVSTAGTATLTVATMDDNVDEANGSLTAEVRAGTGYTFTGTPSAMVTVNDNDPAPPSITLTVNPAMVGEGAGATDVMVTASLDGPSTLPTVTTVTLSLGGTAQGSGTDYMATTLAAITIAAGDTEGTTNFTITPTDDTEVEVGGETIVVSGTATDGFTGTVNSATVTLTDNDAAPAALALPAVAASQTYTMGTPINPLTLPQATGGTMPYMYTLTGPNRTDLSQVPGLMFTAGTRVLSGTPTMAVSSITLTYTARDNAGTTITRTFTVTVNAPTVTPTQPTIRITAGAAVTEGRAATFTVTASSQAPVGALTVNVGVTEMGNFISGAAPTTVTIQATQTSATLTVATADDDLDEANGSIMATVTMGSGYTIASIPNNSATVTVTDNDGPPPATTEMVREVSAGVAGRALATNVAAVVRGRLRAPRGFAPLSQTQLLDTVNLHGLGSIRKVGDLKHLLLGSEFAYALAAAGDGAPDAWEVWGRGGWRRLSGKDGSLSWDGDQYGFHLGLDRVYEDLLMGVMLGYHTGTLDYRLGGQGELDSYLFSVHPYLALSLTPHLQVWAALGYGSGKVETIVATTKAKEDLSLWTGSVGLEGRVETEGGTDAVVSGFASVASSAQFQDENTRVYLLGIEAEVGHRLVLGGSTARPFLLVAGRHDAGDLESGTALEVGGGLEWSLPGSGMSVSLRGRTQVNSTANEEHGVSGELMYDLHGDGLGLQLSLVPQLGGATTMRLDPTQPVSHVSPVREGGAGLASELGYGLATGRGLLRPHGRFELAESLHRFELGVRLESRSGFDLGLDLERSVVPGTDRAADHAGMVNARLRF